MSFLDNFINKHKPMESNMSTDDVDEEIIEDSDVVTTESNDTYISETQPVVDNTRAYSVKRKKPTPTEVLAGPMAEFLKTRTALQQDPPLINFFKGLLPDIERLSAKRQRSFKEALVKLVNGFVDAEEQEQSRPPSTYSDVTSPPSASPPMYNNFRSIIPTMSVEGRTYSALQPVQNPYGQNNWEGIN